MKKNKGFTLFELLAVLVIFAIIATFAVPKVIKTINTAKEKTIAYNCRVLAHLINQNIIYFSPDKYFSKSGTASPDEFLSIKIEVYLESIINSEYSNEDNYKNPYSGRTNVFNWDNLGIVTVYDKKYIKPAIFITNDDAAKYSDFALPAGKETYFQGTIMVYMSNDVDVIEIYFVDKELNKSQLLYTSK